RLRRVFLTFVNRLILGENAKVLPTLPAGFARLVYIDPPFNTQRVQKRDRIRVRASTRGRTGFKGKKYAVEKVRSGSYADRFDDYVGFLIPRIESALRCMTADASLFVHLDAREVHYV